MLGRGAMMNFKMKKVLISITFDILPMNSMSFNCCHLNFMDYSSKMFFN